eukprot:Lankesteria_metandrocarpae@DN10995_c0_g1_i1.p1
MPAVCAAGRFLVVMLSVVLFSWVLDVSWVYHYVRGQSFMKLYVLFNMLEITESHRRTVAELSTCPNSETWYGRLTSDDAYRSSNTHRTVKRAGGTPALYSRRNQRPRKRNGTEKNESDGTAPSNVSSYPVPCRTIYSFSHIPSRRIGFMSMPITALFICFIPWSEIFTCKGVFAAALVWLCLFLLKCLSSVLLVSFAVSRVTKDDGGSRPALLPELSAA